MNTKVLLSLSVSVVCFNMLGMDPSDGPLITPIQKRITTLGDYFPSTVSSTSKILEEISALEKNPVAGTSALEQNKRLAALYQGLSENSKNKKTNSQQFAQISREYSTKVILLEKELAREKELAAKKSAMEVDIAEVLQNKNEKKELRLETARLGYQELITLCGTNDADIQKYTDAINTLEMRRQRREAKATIKALTANNDIASLACAYQSLLATYNPEKDKEAAARKLITAKVDAIEETLENQKRDSDITELSRKLDKAAATKYTCKAEQLIAWANIVSTRAKKYSEDKRYTQQAAQDSERAKKLAFQAAGQKEFSKYREQLTPGILL